MAGFDTSLRDSQSTEVEMLSPQEFDFDRYAAYAQTQDQKVRAFLEADSGVLVYRRFRVAEVYGYECRDRELSLKLQLGALSRSMEYAADMANYLEPWYGIGVGASAFGADYIWMDGQAPALPDLFQSLEEALAFDPKPIHLTRIGQDQMAYVEYFLEKTKGKLPLSFCDVQSPLNIVSEIMPTSVMFEEMLEDPDAYSELAYRASGLMKDYLLRMKDLIGEALALPGHGFASSRRMTGLGASADTSIMISNDMFDDLEAGQLADLCAPFGGSFYHSCGNWGKKIPSVLKVSNLIGADGAFSIETDPSPNDPATFGQAFAGTGKILNTRVVGDVDTVVDTVKKLWHPGLRLIVNTYCKTPEEQQEAYDRIHEICR
ncbi:MAG: hypothetical protein IKE58_07990 [Blautia sp.]|nr:hypothetical protein [Blautia sp.]